MKIIINEKNREKLAEAINEVQKRTTARNISVETLFNAIDEIEDTLGIKKKSMIGIVADVDWNAQDFPRAYKYTPKSTQVTIERFPSGWTLTNVERYRCRSPKRRFCLTLTETAKKAIIESKEQFG